MRGACAVGPARLSQMPESEERRLDSLANHLLVAMPQMQDHRFVRSVIYLCAGAFWNLEYVPGRGVIFSFMREGWRINQVGQVA